MSLRRFSMVSPSIWNSRRFAKLTNESKLLQLYLITCGHQNSCGCFALPDLYACADLGWELPQYQSARQELIDAGLIAYGPEKSFVFVRNWFKHCSPANEKHKIGTLRLVSEIKDEAVRSEVVEEFNEAEERRMPVPSLPLTQSTRLLESTVVRRK